MTTPVTVATPAVRAAPGQSAGPGSTDSAAPFASALDGALTHGRDRLGDATGGGGDRRETYGDPATEGDVSEGTVATPALDAAAVGVAAALWALALAGGTAAGQVSAGVDVPLPGTVGPDTATPAGGTAATAGASITDSAPGAPMPIAGDTATPSAPAAPGTAVTTTATSGTAGALAAGTTGSSPTGAFPTGAFPTGAAVAVAEPVLPSVPEVTVVAAAPAGPATPEVGAAPNDTSLGAQSSSAGTPSAGAAPAPGQGPGSHAGSGDGRPEQQPASAVVPAEVLAATEFRDLDTGSAALPAIPTPAAGAVTATAPVPEIDGTSGTAPTPPVAGQLSRQVAVLSSAGDGSHTMTLVLTPENLGPVEVRVTVNQGSLDLQLRGAHDLGRAALMDALPELRRDLEAAGLSPSRVEVDADTGGSWLAKHAAEQQAHREAQQGFGDRGAQPDQTGERSRSRGSAADSGEGRPDVPTDRSTSSGVDVLV